MRDPHFYKLTENNKKKPFNTLYNSYNSSVTFLSLVLVRSHTTYNQQERLKDFGEEDDLSNEDALHGYDGLTIYLLAW